MGKCRTVDCYGYSCCGFLAGRLKTADSALEYRSRRSDLVAGDLFVFDTGQQHRDGEGGARGQW